MHRGSENNRPTIPGMVLAIERPHQQYGSAIFVRTDLAIEEMDMSNDHDIKVLSVELSSVVVTSVHQPPRIDFMFSQPIPKVHSKPQIIICDFNSHSTHKDGEEVGNGWILTN